MHHFLSEDAEAFADLAVVYQGEARPNRDRAAQRVNGKLNFLAFFQAKCLDDVHRKRHCEGASGLYEGPLHKG